MSVKPYPSDHPQWPRHAKTGILLVNLGTPDGTDTPSMRRYLKEFLSDRRVVEVPRLLWWLILNLIILNIRPRKSGDAYASIWLDDEDGSPLRKYTRLQAEHMTKVIGERDDVMVDYAMRYGNPSIVSRLDMMQKAGCNRFVIVPLYPQYAASTTATVNDEVFKWALKQRWMPAIRTAPPWHDHPVYIKALADSFRDFQAEHGSPDMLQLSFLSWHPCMKTARLVREELDWRTRRPLSLPLHEEVSAPGA